MEQLSAFQMTVISAVFLVISVNLASGQLSTPCTTSMSSTFTPCANFMTGSSNNGATPSTTCCDSLRDLMKTSTACACMVISANVPIPLNGTLAFSLPQACNMNGVPAQCQATGSPLAAPGPALLAPGGSSPTLPPMASSPLSPRATGSPLAAPGPALLVPGGSSPTLPPMASSPLSPQATGSPLASPGPALLAPGGSSPTLPPIASSPLSPRVMDAAAASKSEAPAPASTRARAEAPTKSSRIRPLLTPPEFNNASHVSIQHFLSVFIGLAIVIFGTY